MVTTVSAILPQIALFVNRKLPPFPAAKGGLEIPSVAVIRILDYADEAIGISGHPDNPISRYPPPDTQITGYPHRYADTGN